MSKNIQVVIEISGGNLDGVYSDGDVDFIIVDWDNIGVGDKPYTDTPSMMRCLSDETRNEIANANIRLEIDE